MWHRDIGLDIIHILLHSQICSGSHFLQRTFSISEWAWVGLAPPSGCQAEGRPGGQGWQRSPHPPPSQTPPQGPQCNQTLGKTMICNLKVLLIFYTTVHGALATRRWGLHLYYSKTWYWNCTLCVEYCVPIANCNALLEGTSFTSRGGKWRYTPGCVSLTCAQFMKMVLQTKAEHRITDNKAEEKNNLTNSCSLVTSSAQSGLAHSCGV